MVLGAVAPRRSSRNDSVVVLVVLEAVVRHRPWEPQARRVVPLGPLRARLDIPVVRLARVVVRAAGVVRLLQDVEELVDEQPPEFGERACRIDERAARHEDVRTARADGESRSVRHTDGVARKAPVGRRRGEPRDRVARSVSLATLVRREEVDVDLPVPAVFGCLRVGHRKPHSVGFGGGHRVPDRGRHGCCDAQPRCGGRITHVTYPHTEADVGVAGRVHGDPSLRCRALGRSGRGGRGRGSCVRRRGGGRTERAARVGGADEVPGEFGLLFGAEPGERRLDRGEQRLVFAGRAGAVVSAPGDADPRTVPRRGRRGQCPRRSFPPHGRAR